MMSFSKGFNSSKFNNTYSFKYELKETFFNMLSLKTVLQLRLHLMNMAKVMTAVVKTTSRTAMYMPEMSRYASHSQMELFYILQIIMKEKQ